MTKFIAGLALGLTISAAIAQRSIPTIIDCGPSNKAVMDLEPPGCLMMEGHPCIPMIRPYDSGR